MDALTALLRHIKLEPLIGGNAAPAQPALKGLTEAPVLPAAGGSSAEAEPDATRPHTGNPETVRGNAAQNTQQARLAAAAGKTLIQQDDAPDAYTTRVSPDAASLSRMANAVQSNHAPMPAPLPLNVAAQLPMQVAQTLNTSLAQSGVFYESHLQQWVAGERSLEALHQEPHNRLVSSPAQGAATPAKVAETGLPAAAAAADEAAALDNNLLRSMPETLQPVVREQLNALDFQRVLWQGQVWPQQHAELEIAREHHPRGQKSEAEQIWHSTLRIELPGLGTVVAQVLLDDEQGARVNLRASPEAIEALRPGGETFRQAMDAAGITLRQLELSAAQGEGDD